MFSLYLIPFSSLCSNLLIDEYIHDKIIAIESTLLYRSDSILFVGISMGTVVKSLLRTFQVIQRIHLYVRTYRNLYTKFIAANIDTLVTHNNNNYYNKTIVRHCNIIEIFQYISARRWSKYLEV